MKIMYIDCQMGAAGDMLTAALLELLDEEQRALFTVKMNRLGIDGITFMENRVTKCGIKGTLVTVLVNGIEEGEDMYAHEHGHNHGHAHSHNDLSSIRHLICDHMNISDKIKEDVMKVYQVIAEAESKVHGIEVDNIHFHEVGSLDAICDITAVCILMDMIMPDKVVASPVHVGSGSVRCAHGVLPVPAPATALILQGIPSYSADIQGELCTPTGAALLKYFVDDFDYQPLMSTDKIGYGMGRKDFERANCVRILLGSEPEYNITENTMATSALNKNLVENSVKSSFESPFMSSLTKKGEETICELDFNVDDMTGEELGYAMNLLMEEGALEVFTSSIYMKKNRPGVRFTLLCSLCDEERLAELIFRHTTTLGIRRREVDRITLNRRQETVETEYGFVRKKISEGFGVIKEKLEFEDIAAISRRENKSIRQIRAELEKR